MTSVKMQIPGSHPGPTESESKHGSEESTFLLITRMIPVHAKFLRTSPRNLTQVVGLSHKSVLLVRDLLCQLEELWIGWALAYLSYTPRVPLICFIPALIPASNREPSSTNRTATKRGKWAEFAILRTWLQHWLCSIPSLMWLLARLSNFHWKNNRISSG